MFLLSQYLTEAAIFCEIFTECSTVSRSAPALVDTLSCFAAGSLLKGAFHLLLLYPFAKGYFCISFCVKYSLFIVHIFEEYKTFLFFFFYFSFSCSFVL